MGNRNSSQDDASADQEQEESANNSSQAVTEQQTESRPSYWQLIKYGYNEMVNAIIRPPRADYTLEMLGPVNFHIDGVQFKREDLELTNQDGKKLVCSHWEPAAGNRISKKLPCIIYLHGNASCRAEALECLPLVLSCGLTLFSLDMSGSGKSDGEYISLGWYEREDVKTVVEYLRSLDSVSTIGLWGRSMGAVTALLHGYRDPSIACMILDSPFASLQQLARELVDHAEMNIPKFAVGLALRMVRGSVKSRANFDINKLEPAKHADKCFIPALFGCAENDVFIRPHHSQQIHDRYAGDKNIVKFSGDHNTAREDFFFHSVSIFLQYTLVRPAEMELGKTISSPHKSETEPETNDGFRVSQYDMPAPLSETGGGIGIQVGRPQTTAPTVEQFPSSAITEDYYEEAMIRHAIELSLAEQNIQDNDSTTDQNVENQASSLADAANPPSPPDTGNITQSEN